MILITVSFLIALCVTWVATPRVLNLALRLGVMAVPRERDVHTEPKPRWGGIAIYAGVMVATLLTVTLRQFRPDVRAAWTEPVAGMLIGATFIAIVGLIDDVRDLRAVWQALAILCAGAMLIAFGVRIEGIANPFKAQLGHHNPESWIALSYPVSVALTLFWILLVTKTVDAIDGLDGLAAGVCAISSATLALLAAASAQKGGPVVALIAAAVTGSCVGFLRFNYSPARIFMSTVGAQFLGFMLAALSIMGTSKIAAAVSVAIPVLVLGVPIFDYAFVLLRRLQL